VGLPDDLTSPVKEQEHMIDWGLAVKIAAGGFAMVFFLLAVLYLLVWAGSRVVLRMTKEKAKT
jgi:hypothetical protein